MRREKTKQSKEEKEEEKKEKENHIPAGTMITKVQAKKRVIYEVLYGLSKNITLYSLLSTHTVSNFLR